MAKTDKAPAFVRVGNIMTTTLLRAGFKFNGLGLKDHPAYLLTVRGRKSGQPRTLPIVIIEQNGQRYLNSPFGMVNWVRNLQSAGEAILTRGRRSETVRATQLPPREAALVLQEDLKNGNPFGRNFGVTAESSLEEFERTVLTHPIFLLEKKESDGRDV
ncbi:MAG TPA: nitroreductase/quinone reductase family protein [Ktedonobacteraceae bacterium]|nr:nitroreductase/quinone reductase family protein [Ktedonobacteraceae bacterium]